MRAVHTLPSSLATYLLCILTTVSIQAAQISYGTGTMMGVQAVDVVELAGVKATAAVMLATEEAKDPFLNVSFSRLDSTFAALFTSGCHFVNSRVHHIIW